MQLSCLNLIKLLTLLRIPYFLPFPTSEEHPSTWSALDTSRIKWWVTSIIKTEPQETVIYTWSVRPMKKSTSRPGKNRPIWVYSKSKMNSAGFKDSWSTCSPLRKDWTGINKTISEKHLLNYALKITISVEFRNSWQTRSISRSNYPAETAFFTA